MPMKRSIWLMCFHGCRKHAYKAAFDARKQARYTLLYDKIGLIVGGRAFRVFFSACKIKAALQRNAAEKRLRAHRYVSMNHIMQHVLGNFGPGQFIEMLPYMNCYKINN